MGMFGYMTDTETVEPTDTVEVESEGERENETYLNHIYSFPEFYFNKSNWNSLVETQNEYKRAAAI